MRLGRDPGFAFTANVEGRVQQRTRSKTIAPSLDRAASASQAPAISR